ncbi:Bcr/CflA family efflux MFS transporter [Sphingomonas sp. AP4-R1]|uniref:Bcr/CflA family efflux MFS transporter n=1 Tax=Sphingomonas sp. AP4-R1 TaxID=2735134 RepID=UPI001C101C06|nr:Bcr/CflA family efflux MFS transporter [Sphingomonas sp. AP4-R1]
MVTLSGTLAIHIFIPAMAMAAADLQATPAAMQLTTSFYVVGLALGQLVYGPLADRHGRRQTLLGGLALYTLGGLAAWTATDAGTLAAARLVQALGGCSGMVIARAVVRDTMGPARANRGLATMNLMMTAGPGIAPLIGGFVAEAFGWRSIMALLVLMGSISLLCVFLRLPETHMPGLPEPAGTILRRYLHLAFTPHFLGYAVGGAFATTSWYAFIGAAPGIFFVGLGQTPRATGVCMGIIVGGLWIGTVVGWRLAGRLTAERLLITGSLLSLVAAILFLFVMIAMNSVTLVTSVMFLFTAGIGIAGPAALAQALGANDAMIGSASGLYGFVQMAMGALCTAAVNLGRDPGLWAACVMLAAGIGAQVMFRMGRAARLQGES